jgi:hypothetical protein
MDSVRSWLALMMRPGTRWLYSTTVSVGWNDSDRNARPYLLDGKQVKFSKIIDMNHSIRSAWGSHPTDLALLSLGKEHSPKAPSTSIAHARANDNTIKHLTLDNFLFKSRTPLGYEGHFVEIEGGSLGANGSAIVAIYPHTRSSDKD